jgi:hypothetical protein
MHNYTCNNCGVEFERRNRSKSTLTFCSRSCFAIYRKQNNEAIATFACKVCGKEFLAYKTLRQGENVCCSRPCAGAYKKISYLGDGNPFYGKHHSEDTKAKLAENDTTWMQSAEYKAKVSAISKARGCGGLRYYQSWVNSFGIERANELEQQRRKKLSASVSGDKNTMFGKPAPIGSGNGYGGWYKSWYFRSLRELSYMIDVIEKEDLEWESAEQRKLAIPYHDITGNRRTYYADFFISDIKLVEVKPAKLINTPLNTVKFNAANQFCHQRGYNFIVTDIEIISTSKLKEFYNNGTIQFNKTSEPKFLKITGA